MRQTSLPLNQLIEMCEAQLKKTNECDPHCGSMPTGFLLNEIGCIALLEKDRTAQKYLLGLLGYGKAEWRYLSFCYLLQISKSDLESGDVAILEAYKKKSENLILVRKALDELYKSN